jgi:hypothetical protein
MLALLELEGLGAPADGSTPEGKWFPDTRAYLEKRAQLRRDKASLVVEVAGLKQTVEKVEKERNDALAQAYKAGVERDNALAEVAQLKAARDKERDLKAKAAQAAWDMEVAENRAKRAALLQAEKVREEVEKAREEAEKRRIEALIAAHAERLRTKTAAEKLAEVRDKILHDARDDVFHGVAIVRNPVDAQKEADLTAEVEAEEREKIAREEAKEAEAERLRQHPETEEERKSRELRELMRDYENSGHDAMRNGGR